MRATSEAPALVTFRGGFVADWVVVRCLLDLEARGARFELKPDGGFRVIGTLLSADETAFLRLHRDEARAILAYQADDAHLFTDRRQAARLSGAAAPRERTA